MATVIKSKAVANFLWKNFENISVPQAGLLLLKLQEELLISGNARIVSVPQAGLLLLKPQDNCLYPMQLFCFSPASGIIVIETQHKRRGNL